MWNSDVEDPRELVKMIKRRIGEAVMIVSIFNVSIYNFKVNLSLKQDYINLSRTILVPNRL